MKTYPTIPRVADAPDLLDGGHLWIQEKVDGAHCRFQLRETGAIRFGDRDRVYGPDDVPESYRHVVRHVRERLDREALRQSVGDVESVVFFGEATHRRTIDYDWDRTPSFLGFDVWSGDRFLPPDAVEQIYDRLGLDPVNTFQKEVRASDFDPDDYEVPGSKWYDGPAEGIVLRTKTGERAKLIHPEFEADDDPSADVTVDELASEYVTSDRMSRIAQELEGRERPVTFDALFERVLEGVAREAHGKVFDESSDLDAGEFRSEVAARVREFLNERE